MRKTMLGMAVGAVLGFLDGMSAWAYPEARSMMTAIVVGSTLKGLVTGMVAGVVATRVRSTPVGVLLGLAVGWLLSAAAAQGQPGHYWDIVLPGMLVGAIAGYVTQRYPRRAAESRSTQTVAVLAFTIGALCSGSTAAQTRPDDPLAAVDFLVGRWEGSSEGKPGTGAVHREYARVLGGRFIRVENASTYPPQEKNPKGEKHEDVGFISFDRSRKRLVLRQFHVEGFVNEYVAELPGAAGPITFTTESIENIPAGWRARETYTMLPSGELEERFELAEPGKDFEVYSVARLRRVRR